MSEHANAENRDSGDRAAFLGRLRDRQERPPTLGPHPPPPEPESVPELRWKSLRGVDLSDPAALLAVFVEAAIRAEATVEVVDSEAAAGAAVLALAARLDSQNAIASREEIVERLRPHLVEAGLVARDYEPVVGAAADLAITGAAAAIAVTGSVVVDSDEAGGRGASLLTLHHCCVITEDQIVPTTAEVLRRPRLPMPGARVVISGPSRTGDIEQILSTGVHGPATIHIVVIRGAR